MKPLSCCIQLMSPFLLSGLMSGAMIADAQIIPDTTLPTNSRVTVEGVIHSITEGTARGTNLFHSFEQFSLPTGETAHFLNDAGIQNILTRITGQFPSNINGTIQAEGTANLFLINPHGIVFGENARLDIGGSFFASTADSILFNDGTAFSTTLSQSSPLLTVNLPIGVQLGANSGAIRLEGSQLSVSEGQTLGLIGNGVELFNTNLTAPAGRIELGSVAEGVVTLDSSNSFVASYETIETFQNLTLLDNTIVQTTGNSGGNIQLLGQNVEVIDSQVIADTTGTGDGGIILVNGSESFRATRLNASERPGLRARMTASATGSNAEPAHLTINTKNLTVENGAWVDTVNSSSRQGGSITVNASERLEILSGRILAVTTGSGKAGDLLVTTEQLIISNPFNESTGLTTTAFSSNGQGGNLTITASNIDVEGENSFIAASTLGTQNAGTLTIQTDQLRIRNGAQINSLTSSSGKGGSIGVTATESIEVIGEGDTLPSGLFVNTQGSETSGNAGTLNLNTGRLVIRQGGQVFAGTGENTSGQGGNLTVKASESIEVSGSGTRPSGLFTNSDGTGNAGILSIETKQLIIEEGGLVSVASQVAGEAGNLEVFAPQIFLNQGRITAETVEGDGGNIFLNASDIRLRNNSQITTQAEANATGGGIIINTNTLVALENSDINANANQGFGGQIIINANSIFRSTDSEITAVSQQGPQFNGVVEINTPEVDSSAGLVELPANVINVEGLIAQNACSPETNTGSSFAVIGRGGLPASPNDTLTGETLLVDWVTLALPQGENRQTKNFSVSHSDEVTQSPIFEATGWKFDSQGNVILTASLSPTDSSLPQGADIKCN